MSDVPAFRTISSQNVSYVLPVSYSREIGRIMVRWAFFENYVQRMVYATAFLGDSDSIPLGRISIHEPKFPDRFELLLKLASIRNVTLNRTLVKTMKTKSKALVEKRNLLAHGIWAKEPGVGWIVQQSTGSWNEGPGSPKGSKKIKPEAVPMGIDDLKGIVSGIDDLLVDTTKLHECFRGQPKS